jgi:two-component system response regulator NreC
MASQTQKTRVVIADDYAVVRAGLRAVLTKEPEYVVVHEAQDGASVVQAVDRLLPDLVVMDLATKEASGLDAIAEIKERHPDTRIFVFTGNRSRDHVLAALRAGANGYALKDTSIPDLLAALACTRKGQTYLCPEIAGFVIGAYFHQTPGETCSEAPLRLSQREAAVLKMVATGRTSKQIAGHLFISPRTVEKHRAHLMRKLNLSNVAALVMFAIGSGLVDEAEAAARFVGSCFGG